MVKRYVLKRRTNYNKTDNTTRHVLFHMAINGEDETEFKITELGER